ncbi:PIN domain-containing protein [Candidatus Saccharibacteria bacterium]|nr:PIN domain-containing protein [Candidatus Saccharibacteria bacterium]
MKVLIDTNVIIDALQSRKGFLEDAGWVLLKSDRYDGYITASSITDIYYLYHRFTRDRAKTKQGIMAITEILDILDTTGADCRNAMRSDISDYEDAVLVETSLREKIDIIVTRNQKDFRNSPVKICSPLEFLEILASERKING